MRIRIPIPKRVLAVYDRFEDWANVSIGRLWRLEVVRLDIFLAIMFVVCVGWYYYTSGWMGAATGGLLYIFLLICALWIWRK